MKLTDEQIEQIAESIEAGFTCKINPDTGEIEEIRGNDEFDLIPDEDDEYFEDYLESETELEKEIRLELKAQTERINSWKRIIVIEKPDSFEAFLFMEDFVNEVIPETEQEMYRKALKSKGPFSNFNVLIHDSEHLDKWYEFKKKELIDYVTKQLNSSC